MLTTVGRAQSIWELSPYRVHVSLACPAEPELTPRFLADLQASLLASADAVIGAPWDLSVSQLERMAAADAAGDVRAFPVDRLPGEARAADKAVLIALTRQAEGYRLEARQYDAYTQLWGAVIERNVLRREELPAAAFACLEQAVTPLAKIETVDDNMATLRVKASALPRRSGSKDFAPGTVFRAVLRAARRGSSEVQTREIPWTYLVAVQFDGQLLHARIYTGLRDPLSARHRGRTEQVALGVGVPQGESRLRLVSRTSEGQPLAGYDVYSHPPGDKATQLLGRTDFAGELEVSAAPELLRVLLVKSGTSIVARLPLVPGLEPELVARVPDDSERLRAEGYITGFQEDLVDLVVRRQLLISRVRRALNRGEAEEAVELFSQLQQLATRDELANRLRTDQKEFRSSDPKIRFQIERYFADTQQLLGRVLDPADVADLASEVNAAKTGE